MIALIVLLDQLVWRPAIAWAEKFKLEQVESANESRTSAHSQPSNLAQWIRAAHDRALVGTAYLARQPRGRSAAGETTRQGRAAAGFAIAAVLVVVVPYGLVKAALVLKDLTRPEIVSTLVAAGATFLRVALSLAIASLWAIPAGVAIGFNPRLARIAQPLAQIAASVPATALFPVVLLALVRLGGGLGVGSIVLMLLGTQWYILFNVIAGAMAIPTELREAASVFRFDPAQRWRTVILPGIFPYLVTGLVTASGGAWNASIVAEYFHFQGRILTTVGLGALSSATDSGNTDLLLLPPS